MKKATLLCVAAFSLACSTATNTPTQEQPLRDRASNPMTADNGAKPLAGKLSAQIQEVIQVKGYTYLRVEAKAGDSSWVAINKRKVEVGNRVDIITLAKRKDFYSKKLDRTFPSLTFGILL